MSRAALSERVRLFGIRHHGPGSARSLVRALEDWQPDLLLVEGPAEAEPLLPLLVEEGVEPPVALLLYAVENPRQASFYPLAEFSPELQAVRWAIPRSCPIRLMDLPASASLALKVSREGDSEALADLAEAAGFLDIEEWWEHLVEQRADPQDLFEGIAALMTALREPPSSNEPSHAEPSSTESLEEDGSGEGREGISGEAYDQAREAHMRKVLREALKGSAQRIAVVCGAWHVPALQDLPPARQDEALLKGLPKVKVGATLAPWSFDRLTSWSGYGAGARSPAFYDLLWRAPSDQIPALWLMSVAQLLRKEDLDASPASVIEAVRLAEALASLRGRSRPGLQELCDSASSILIRDEALWQLIGRRLIVGERMGSVPDSAPSSPLESDLAAQAKRLRLKRDDTDRRLELDLRGETDRERSLLLHRLNILGVPWGSPEKIQGKKGTFHEHWTLQWRPELTISLIEAGIYGSDILSAATSCAREKAGKAGSLAEISGLVEEVLLADLPGAIEAAVDRLQALSATGAGVADLADSLPPLASVVRYGTVRKTEADRVVPVLEALFSRLCLGLPGACLSLDDEAAQEMSHRLGSVSGVVRLFQEEDKERLWLDALEAVADLQGGHFLVRGRAERLRFDFGAVSGDHIALRLTQESSSGASAQEAAAFVEGLLEGPGAILLHQEPLFQALDEWLMGLEPERFDEALPLVRRTFALFTPAERRQIGEKTAGGRTLQAGEAELDEERARRILPTLRMILGLNHD